MNYITGVDMNKGFSLIEVLVAITLFALVSVTVSGIFVNVNSLQQNTASLERLQNDGRYILEKLAREIRGRRIDYKAMRDQNFISDISTSTQTLIFKPDEQDVSVEIYWNAGDLIYSVDIEGVVESASLNASDVKVAEVKFVVQPGDDPTIDFFPGIQPRVTVLLKLENRDVVPKYRKELTLQTTISSKFYSR